MKITDQEVQAYVDGELEPGDAARVDAAIASDALVAARVQREKRLRMQLRGAFDPILAEPVPDRITALLASRAASLKGAAGNVVGLPGRSATWPTRQWRRPLLAIAASVAALALFSWMRAPDADIGMQDGVLVAQGTLADGLDRALASTPDATAPVAIGLTFRDRSGRVCRTFLASASATAGLACRQDGRWMLDTVGQLVSESSQDVRQARSAMSPAVQAAVDARLEGDAFDAGQERAAQAKGWR